MALLRDDAERHWFINANRSLACADEIIAIGQARADVAQIALGLLTRGDALKYLGQLEEAWDALEQAGQRFQSIDDEVGWARTRIGQIGICVDLNRVASVLTDADMARAIFDRHHLPEKRLVLDLNVAVVYKLLGNHQQALQLYHTALSAAQGLGDQGQRWLGLLYTNIGNVYTLLGDFRQAIVQHEQAYQLAQQRNETSLAAMAQQNLAHIAIAQGHYRRALDLLHRALAWKQAAQLPLDAAHIKRSIVECYLLLNRYGEARDLARQVSAEFRDFGAVYEEAYTLLHLAVSEAELGDFQSAHDSLARAEASFASLHAPTWIATTRLRRGQIAHRQGDYTTAAREASIAATSFKAYGQIVDYAAAKLLQGQVSLGQQHIGAAAQAGAAVLQIARQSDVPALRYAAHVLLGRIAEAQDDPARAAQRYRAAAIIVERVQRRLTITLRPGFLADKEEALRALIGLHLRAGESDLALETLERAKSQVLLGYLANQEHLRWATKDPACHALIEELDQLRAEHQWFYRLAHDQSAGGEDERQSRISAQQAAVEVAQREQRMRAITEQLYIRSSLRDEPSLAPQTTIRDLQRRLDGDTLLIEFFNDGYQLWAFTLDAQSLGVHPLPASAADLDRLLAQFQVNLAGALKLGPRATATRKLTEISRRILGRLYEALLAPLAERTYQRKRLIVVPYGALHYLPMHLLHTGAAYLIERYEVVTLPAAGLLTRRAPTREGGARVLAHSWDGRLPQTLREAQIVGRLFGGELHTETEARRAALQAQPSQILHIAAHGEHRLDQPDLSYIQLADGQLYADDLLQQDLSYELVTLSACETGRAHISGGDELIGLGRGFLYAGAGALVGSLWRVADDSAAHLMESMYRALRDGASKAAALRDAQRSMLAAAPHLHPAFWGAFQLIGDASPLSTYRGVSVRKEHTHE